MRTLLPALLALVACGPGQQPAAPIRELAPPTDTLTLAEPDVTDAVWIGGDRWAILTPYSKSIQVIDFKARTTRPLGRPGTDYLEPFAIFRAGDTLYVDDWGKRRVTFWTLAGAMVGSLEVPAALRGTLPHGRDGSGNWYAELRPLPGVNGIGNLDSGSVVRWKEGPTADTIIRLAPFAVERVSRDGASRYERTVFGGVDQWGVYGDGCLWVARVRENQVVHCGATPGSYAAGPPLPDRVLEVTLQDREYFLQGFPADQRTLARSVPFSITKPPFERAFASVDEIFLEKSRDLTDTLRSYARLTTAGLAVQELRLPNAQRILAAGGGHLLAIDPLVPGPGHRVFRYRLPAIDSVTIRQ